MLAIFVPGGKRFVGLCNCPTAQAVSLGKPVNSRAELRLLVVSFVY